MNNLLLKCMLISCLTYSHANIYTANKMPKKTSYMQLSRVILASNENPDYLDFWPIAAKAWSKLINIKPTLILIGNKDLKVDKTVGEVIFFDPIPNVSTSFQAQVVRLLAPALFPDEVCIISDIDQIPLNKDYFVNSVKNIPDDCFVVYRKFISHKENKQFPMCYNAALGSVFQDIFKIKNMNEIRQLITEWSTNEYKKFDWYTDQYMLYEKLMLWQHQKEKCIYLGHDWIYRKLHDYDWPVSLEKLSNFYIDAGLRKPLLMFNYNHELIDSLGLNQN